MSKVFPFPTEAMVAATNVDEMATAFHPTEVHQDEYRHSHLDPIMDAVEAALLFGARRISQSDFISAIDDLQEFMISEHEAGRDWPR